jgi:adenylate kinase family enzyme
MLVEELEEDMHLVFDGAPRSHSEAVLLSTAFQFYKREKPTVIFLDVSTKWAEERLLARGRQDDKALAKITKRLDWFEEDTWPAIEYFKTNSLYRFVEINGEQAIEKVHNDIVAAYDYTA